MKQTITSAATSINGKKLPAVYKSAAFRQAMKDAASVTDFGAGKYDNARDHIRSEYGKTLYTYDPYNRTEEENAAALDHVADLGIISNVLNVINSAEARADLLKLARDHARTVLITVYEGNRSGHGRQTGRDSWQENRKTADYLQEVRAIFPAARIAGRVIIATL